jgi:peptidoglycan-associated lipoprotein
MNNKLAMSVLSTLLISACATEPAVTTTPETKASQTAAESANNNAQSGTEIKPLPDMTSAQLQEMQKKSVYFERDEFIVKAEFNNIIQQQAEYAKAHGLSITLEGNADERGSSEYNLALGSKRANAVKKSLEIMGVPSKQIKTISFGEEKPRATCHEEKCWQENRRVDFNGKPDI